MPRFLSFRSLAVLPLVPLLLGAQPRGTPADSTLVSTLRAYMNDRVAADSFSGAVLVARNGVPILEYAAGMADEARALPNRLDTKFNIGSVNKLLTRIAIRQLQQAGKLSLDDSVGKFLPQYPNPVVRDKVTIGQLWSMKSGVGSYFNEKFHDARLRVRTHEDYLALFASDSLLFEPGSAEAYSNGGYVILGAIIEQVSGQSYYDYVRDHITRAAGMTGTEHYELGQDVPNLASGYTFQDSTGPMIGNRLARPSGMVRMSGGSAPSNGEASGGAGGKPGRVLIGPGNGVRQSTRRSNSFSLARKGSAAGGGYSTVADLLKLAEALRANKLLNAAFTDSLLGSQFRAKDGARPFRHGGGGPGVNAELAIYPNGYTAVVLVNHDPPAATVVALRIAELLGASAAPTRAGNPLAIPASATQTDLRAEVERANQAMVAAFDRGDFLGVARMYTDDARIIGPGGQRVTGREAIDAYWTSMAASGGEGRAWKLEVLEVGGDAKSPYQLGRSTLSSVVAGGRGEMVSEFLGIWKRQPSGELRMYIDMLHPATSAGDAPMLRRRPPGSSATPPAH